MSCRCPGSPYILYAATAAAVIVLMANDNDDDQQHAHAQTQPQVLAQHDHDQHDHDHAHQHGDEEKQKQQRSHTSRGFPDLVTGLKNTEGCLGVETAQTASGKNCIFAWFENKHAAMSWYNSEMHQRAMNMFFPGSEGDREPMQGVPDDIPIMTIASITMSDDPQQRDTTLPVAQIAIELYTPVTGGLHLGGTFAPEQLDVPDLKDYGNLPK